MGGKPNASKRSREYYAIRKARDKRRKERAKSMTCRQKYNMCQRKIRYKTELGALRASMYYSDTYGVKARVYECPICGGWHITTHPASKVNGKGRT